MGRYLEVLISSRGSSSHIQDELPSGSGVPSWPFLDPVQNWPVVWSQVTENLKDGAPGKETEQENGEKDCPETGGMLDRFQTSFPSTLAGGFRWRILMFSGVWGASSPKNDLLLHRGRFCLLAGSFTSGLKWQGQNMINHEMTSST